MHHTRAPRVWLSLRLFISLGKFLRRYVVQGTKVWVGSFRLKWGEQMASQRPKSRKIGSARVRARVREPNPVFANQTRVREPNPVFENQTMKRVSDEIDARECLAAGREQIRKTRDRTLSGTDGARAFWPEAAKNFPLAVHQFRAGKCPHPAAQDPNKARQATSSWRRVRDRKSRNALHAYWCARSNHAAGLTFHRERGRYKSRRRRRPWPDCRRPSRSQFRRHLRRSAPGQQYRRP